MVVWYGNLNVRNKSETAENSKYTVAKTIIWKQQKQPSEI